MIADRADAWDRTVRAFTAAYGGAPAWVARAPGRVNLIGEHTDYNEGLVLPAAIVRHLWIAAAPNGTGRIRLYSAAYDAYAEFPAAAPAEAALPPWARYPQGVAVALTGRGVRLTGLDALIAGDLASGAGLSSSAALEVASALVFEQAAGVALAPRARALLCHQAEVEFVGVPCGIMDQAAVSLSRPGHALFLDCRSLETHHIPLPPDLRLAVCDTGVRRALDASAYAERRRECATAVRWLRERGRELRSLRDLTPDDLELIASMPDPLRRRVRHVVTENARVVETARALEGSDGHRLREIFLASHRSLRDDYEVSSPELDAMVEAALEAPGCLAARMTGAGFGGAAVALVRRHEADAFGRAVKAMYPWRTGRTGTVFTTEAASCAGIVER